MHVDPSQCAHIAVSFECSVVGERDLFRQHLENKHPEVVRNDSHALVSTRVIYAPELCRLVERHSFLSVSEIAMPSTTPPRTMPPSPGDNDFPRSTDTPDGFNDSYDIPSFFLESFARSPLSSLSLIDGTIIADDSSVLASICTRLQ
jgi:hypothetical protein